VRFTVAIPGGMIMFKRAVWTVAIALQTVGLGIISTQAGDVPFSFYVPDYTPGAVCAAYGSTVAWTDDNFVTHQLRCLFASDGKTLVWRVVGDYGGQLYRKKKRSPSTQNYPAMYLGMLGDSYRPDRAN